MRRLRCGSVSQPVKLNSNQNHIISATAAAVALIAPTHSYRASVYLSAAKKRGISVFLVSDGEPSIVPGSTHGIRVDFSDSSKASQSIHEQLKDRNVGAVIAPDEKYVALAAQVSDRLGLPHNCVAALKSISNKHLARESLINAGIDAVPGFRLIDLDQAVPQQISNVQYPCVAKPLNMSASRGVIRANNEKELLNALERIRKLLLVEFDDLRHNRVLVEDYIDGMEYALEGYLADGNLELICIFDKPDPLEGPYFEETYYITPSRLGEVVQERIRRTVLKACICHGLTMGPVHAEVRISGGKIWILEVAARSIGGDCGRLFELATQSSLEEFVLCRAVGYPMETLSLECAAGVLMIPVSEDGILRRIEGATRAQAVANVLEVRLDVREGERLMRWPEGGKYPGFIYAMADTPQAVESALRESYAQLDFVCMPNLPVVVR